MTRFFLWRWLFWRRILCHVHDANGWPCAQPAVWKCVYGYGSAMLGDNYARDPLCAIHGRAGECPSDAHRPTFERSRHVPIPEAQRWRRVRLLFRSPVFFQEV